MYLFTLPVAGPSFLIHAAIIVAAALTLPVIALIKRLRKHA
jgi:hypothetical protein